MDNTQFENCIPPRPITWHQVNEAYWYEQDKEYGYELRHIGYGFHKGKWGIHIARWDKPDWFADTLEDAKKLCEMGPPRFAPPGQFVIDIPSDF